MTKKKIKIKTMKKKLKNIIPLICEEWNFIYFFLTGQKNKSMQK
jgi:hypothetical protein